MKALFVVLFAIIGVSCSSTDEFNKPPPSARAIAKKEPDARMRIALGYLDLGLYDHSEAYAKSLRQDSPYHELAQLTLEVIDLARKSYNRTATDNWSSDAPTRHRHAEWETPPAEIDLAKEKKFLLELSDYYRGKLVGG